MKKIKIFLGSSITEFEKERNDLELFIRNISDEFEEKYNIKLVPLRCENMDNYVRADGTQNAINEDLVLDSDMCFFIFFTKAGESTEKEFRIAFEKFKKDGKPKIYIYFKNIPEGQTVEESVHNFMSKIDNELKHYHGSFDHLDTIKLRILLNLKLQEMDFVSVEFENGKCVVDGKQTLDLSNVSEFANSKVLKELNNELKEVEKEYYRLKRKYNEKKMDDTFYHLYSQVATKRQNLLDSIEELQKNIFNISLRMCKNGVHGDITIRQKEAYHLFELGDYEGAIAVLDADEVDNDFFAFEKREEEKLKKKAQIYIIEHKTAIDILMAMINYDNRFKEIEERYEKIIKVAEKYSVELDVIYDYASYLYDQNKTTEAYKFATMLEEIYDQNSNLTTDENNAYLYNLLGGIFNDIPAYHQKSEEYLLKGIEIIERLVNENSQRYSKNLASIYNNVGYFYNHQGKPQLAEEYYRKAIEVLEKLVNENPQGYSGDLTMIYGNAGVFYTVQGKPQLAEGYYLKSIEILEKLASENPQGYSGDLATSYGNAGVFYKNQGKPQLAEEYYLKSIEILEKLASENPQKYSGDLATSYGNAGVFYKNQGKPQLAEEYYLKSIEILEKLASENPQRYNGDLAMSYNYAGNFYGSQGKSQLAEEYYLKAIEIRKSLQVKIHKDIVEP